MNLAVSKLEQFLKDAPCGMFLSFLELSALAGVDVKTHRSIISCTIRHLNRHHGRTLTNIRGKGYVINKLGEGKPQEHSYMITDVKELDDNGGQQALMVIYRELEAGEPIPKIMDNSIIELLKSRAKE